MLEQEVGSAALDGGAVSKPRAARTCGADMVRCRHDRRQPTGSPTALNKKRRDGAIPVFGHGSPFFIYPNFYYTTPPNTMGTIVFEVLFVPAL